MVAQFDAYGGGEEDTSSIAYFAPLGWSTVGVNGGGNGPDYGIAYAGNPSRPHFYAGPEGGSNNVTGLQWIPPSSFSSATVYHGLSVIFSAGQSIRLVNSKGNAQLALTGNSDGSITVTSGSVTLGRTAKNVYVSGVEFWLDIVATISVAAGAVAVYANGNLSTPIFAASAVDTAADTTALPITCFQYWSSGVTIYVRDGYVHDGTGPTPFNGPLGPGSCIYLPVASLVSNNGFTPNGGATLVANASSAPPNAANFNSASAVAASVTYGLTPVPGNFSKIIAISPIDYVLKTDTGTRALQKSLAFGSNSVAGTNNYLAQGAIPYPDPWIFTDPGTGVLFAKEGATGIAALNAAQLTETVTA
jgi:hypothetical protein